MNQSSLTIANEKDALVALKSALAGKFANTPIALNFDDWPKFEVTIDGGRYQSSITAALMKALIEVQTHINRVYGQIVYNRDGRALTDEERASIEIVFYVEKGSSNLVADLSGFLTELASKAGEKMTGNQIVLTVVGVATLWVAATGYDNYLETDKQNRMEKHRHEVTMAVIAAQPKLAEIQKDQVETMLQILKSAPDADRIELADTKFNKVDIALLQATERKTTEVQRLDAEYRITSLKRRTDDLKVEITRESDGLSISAVVPSGALSIEETQILARAFAIDKPIKLSVVARVTGSRVTTAQIVGVKKLKFENAIASASVPAKE